MRGPWTSRTGESDLQQHSPPQHPFLEMINGSSGKDCNQMCCNYVLNTTQLQKTKVYTPLEAAGG